MHSDSVLLRDEVPCEDLAGLLSQPFPPAILVRLSQPLQRLVGRAWLEVQYLQPAYQPGQVLLIVADSIGVWVGLMDRATAEEEARNIGAPPRILRHLSRDEPGKLVVIVQSGLAMAGITLTPEDGKVLDLSPGEGAHVG